MSEFSRPQPPYGAETWTPDPLIKEEPAYMRGLIREVYSLRERVAALESTLPYPNIRTSKDDFVAGQPIQPADHQNLEQTFRKLADEWRSQTSFISSVIDIVTNASYQRIIGLGPSVIPLILRELSKQPDHWFWALRAITGNEPIPEEDRGDNQLMTQAWLEWGAAHGYEI